jgi:hypothetical protein
MWMETYEHADAAITLQHPLFAVGERIVRLHSHSCGTAVAGSVIGLCVLELGVWFGTGVLGWDVLRVER